MKFLIQTQTFHWSATNWTTTLQKVILQVSMYALALTDWILNIDVPLNKDQIELKTLKKVLSQVYPKPKFNLQKGLVITNKKRFTNNSKIG